MVITEYKNRFNQHYFDMVVKVFHRCGICQEIILLDSDYVASHLQSHKGDQKITHKDYNEKFMIKANVTRNENESMRKNPLKSLSCKSPIIANLTESTNIGLSSNLNGTGETSGLIEQTPAQSCETSG